MYENFYGFNKECVTLPLKSKENLIGKPVTVKDPSAISVCGENDNIFGIIVSQNKSFVTVQLSGYVEAYTSCETSLIGYKSISSDGDGKIKESETGKNVWILKHDLETNQIGFLL